jgi:hypothetical protein
MHCPKRRYNWQLQCGWKWQCRLQFGAVRILRGIRRSINKEDARQKESRLLEYCGRHKRSKSWRSNPPISGPAWVFSAEVDNWDDSSAPGSIYNSADRWRSLRFSRRAIGALKRYGLIPTVTLICAIGESSWCVLSAASIFFSFSISTSALAASFVDVGASSWTYTTNPATTLRIQIGFGGITLDQLASTKADEISSPKSTDSRSSEYGSISNDWPTNRPTRPEISFRSAGANERAFIRDSRAMIFSCCVWLIDSSKRNRMMLQSVSARMPTITNFCAIRCLCSGCAGASHNIPQPTTMVATTSPPISNPWTKVSVMWSLAILSAFFALGCAVWALNREILAGKRKY